MIELDSVIRSARARRDLLNKEGTQVFQLIQPDNQVLPGVGVDVLHEVGILNEFEGTTGSSQEQLSKLAKEIGQGLGLVAVYRKFFPKNRSADSYASNFEKTPLWGRAVPEEFAVLESGLRYIIRPYDGFSYGLFLDQRANRKILANVSRGRDVLNLFSYTCSFGVSAAFGGAKSVANVDVSKKYLEWGRENFRANDIAIENHRFYCRDAQKFLTQAQKKNQMYDIVIVDPPTSGRGSEGHFSIKKDMEDLVTASTSVCAKLLFVATNFLGWPKEEFFDRVGDAVDRQRNKWRFIEKSKKADPVYFVWIDLE